MAHRCQLQVQTETDVKFKFKKLDDGLKELLYLYACLHAGNRHLAMYTHTQAGRQAGRQARTHARARARTHTHTRNTHQPQEFGDVAVTLRKWQASRKHPEHDSTCP